MARGGTAARVRRHDSGRSGGRRRRGGRGQGGRRGTGGRPLRWLAPALVGTLLGTVGAVGGQALPALGTHGHAAAAAGHAGVAPARTGTPGGTRTTSHPAQARPAGTDAPPSGDAAPSTPSTSSEASASSEPTGATDPVTGPLPAVPAAQRRCAQPATGVVTHVRTVPGRTVALTFDDGPDVATPAVLDALAAEHVHATFFVVGSHAQQHPALLRRIADEGHLLGDHTWDHAYPRDVRGGWTAPYLADQLGRTARVVEAATGEPVCWFRPPGGFRTGTVGAAAQRMRMTVALWSVDTLDWQVQGLDHGHAVRPDALEKQVDTIVARATGTGGQRHPVVLLHDGGGPRTATALAVPRIVAWYRAHGYTFVRLDGRS